MSKLKYLFDRLNLLWWRYLMPPERYARHIGVTIGDHCFISTREWGNEPYLITIGDHVQITRGVSIHTHGGANSIRKDHPDFDIFGKVVIKDWAYVGAYSQIMPGVTIGEGSLVAAGSIVTKSVAPHSVVGGNPARYICTTEEFYENNKPFNVSTKGMTQDQKKRILLGLPEEKFVKK